MPVIQRPDRIPLRFSGLEAEKLLNDVITGVVQAEPTTARWWALLSPQGKIQAEGLLGWTDTGFWLDVHASVADAFVRRMKMYRLRARADIEDMRESHIVGWCADSSDIVEGTAVAQRDDRAGGLGWRVIARREFASDWQLDDTAYEQRRIEAGIAELGRDFGPDTNFPHDIAMDILGGIDFAKGCYVGQEVVSRMKHRGTARRRPVMAIAPGAQAGEPIIAGTREAGELGRPTGGRAVAIVRLDRIGEARATTPSSTDVTLILPPWAPYAFGESGAAD